MENKKVKPIFIIRFPDFISEEQYNESTKTIEDNPITEDYHVLFVVDDDVDSIKFECFYSKDFKEIDFEELKKILK